MFTQLYSYLNTNNHLSEQQYGFRSQHSTELACIKLVDYITTEMDNIKKSKVTNCYIFGPVKSFGTLNFNILLNKQIC